MRAGRLHRGFTLLEVLVALSLLMLLSWGMFSVVSDLGERRDRLARMAARQSEGAALFELLESDLWCSVASAGGEESGVVGSAGELRVAFRGVLVADGAGGPRSDLVRSRYRFDAAGGRVLLSRDDGPEEVLAAGIAKFELRYYDGRAWSSEYDSGARGGLPVSVEIAVWYGDGGAGAALEGRQPDRIRQVLIPDGRGGEDGA